MAVILTCQTEMSKTLSSISCLLHTSQSKSCHKSLIRLSFYAVKQLLEFLRMHPVTAYLKVQSKVSDNCTKTVHLLFIWNLMNSVFKRKISPEIFFSNRLIGYKHEVFYDLCGTVSLIWFYLNRLAVFIHYDLCLRHIKIYRAPLKSVLSQFFREFEHKTEHRNKRLISFYRSTFASLEDCCHISIVHSFVYIYNAFTYLMRYYTASVVYIHNTGQSKTVYIMIQ